MAASERRKFLYGAGAGVLAALIWGGYFPVSRLVLRDSALSPEDVAFLRFCIAGVVFLPVLLRHGLKAGRAGWLGSVILTLTVGFPYAFAMALGLGFAPASHGAISVPGMFPVLTAILGFLVLRDPLGARRLVGVGLVLAGVVGVGWHALWQDQLGQWQGYALFFMCGWMWAAFSVTARIASISAVHVTAILSVGSLAVFGPIYGLFGDIQLLELPMGEFLFQLVYQGLGVGVVAMFCYNHAINVLGAAQAASFGGLVPCIAVLLSAPMLGEPLGWAEVGGIAAVTGGIYLVTGARLPGVRRA